MENNIDEHPKTNYVKHMGFGSILTVIGFILSGIGNRIFIGAIIIGIVQLFYGLMGWAPSIKSKKKGVVVSIIWTIFAIGLMIFIAETKMMKAIIDDYMTREFLGGVIVFSASILLWIKRFQNSGKIEMSIYSLVISFFSRGIIYSLVFWSSRQDDFSITMGSIGALVILCICIVITLMSDKIKNKQAH